jgi:hypothetical protein
MKIIAVKKIVSNGQHNAFTGLGYLNGKYYLGFRSASNHVTPASRQIILESSDGMNWREFRNWSLPPEEDVSFDIRDTFIFPDGQELLVSTLVSRVTGEVRSPIAWLHVIGEDQTLIPIGQVASNHAFWKPTVFNVIYYCAAYDYVISGDFQVTFFRSPDRKNWQALSRIGPGSEAVLLPVNDREMLCFVRTEESPYLMNLYRCKVPFYGPWEKVSTDTRILQGQECITWNGEHFLLARERSDYCKTADPNKPSFASHRLNLYRLKNDFTLEKVLEFPSGGDCGYPGCVIEKERTLLVSYYSRHEQKNPNEFEGPADIYVARVHY